MFPDLRSPKGYVGLILMLAMLAAPLALGTPFWTNLFVLLFVFSALSVAWNIVGGYAGQLSLGHAVFYGIGGYRHAADAELRHLALVRHARRRRDLGGRGRRDQLSHAAPARPSSRWRPSPSWRWCACW